MSRTVIHGGLVITASDEIHADVLVEGGRIAALAAHGTDAAESWTADRRIDATGKYVIPGASTRTPTWRCRSAGPTPPTPSRPA
ncbi:dihydropyrimidinase, partial [Streptomyces sp. DvalAA-19]